MSDKRFTVMVVDDDQCNVELVGAVLGAEMDIIFALSGEDALPLVKSEQPDLILLDVQMPVLNGYDVCARLKALPETREIPIVFLTAMEGEEDEARGLEAGAVDYIIKPISPPILLARVRNHLRLKEYSDLLRQLSSLDGLTGIANRRRFEETLDNEWRRGLRSRKPLSVIMADIDYFKAYNDFYGHLSGDDCLRKVAAALAGVVKRPGDLVARWGGEEFACILPETEEAGAGCVADSCLRAVSDLQVPHAASPTGTVVTISLGLASMVPEDSFAPHLLVRMADQRLYEAKKAGRNRVSLQGRSAA